MADLNDVSDLVGELQETQNVTNTSTVAELLKQGAGEEKLFVFLLHMTHQLQFSLFPSRGCLSITCFWVLVHQRKRNFTNPDFFLIPVALKPATCSTWTQSKRNHWQDLRQFVRPPSVLWLWAHVRQQRWSTLKCLLRESLSQTAKDGTWQMPQAYFCMWRLIETGKTIVFKEFIEFLVFFPIVEVRQYKIQMKPKNSFCFPRLFFRRHYPISTVTFSSLDPQDHRLLTQT